MSSEFPSDAEAIIEFAKQHLQPQDVSLAYSQGVPVLVNVPEKMRTVDLTANFDKLAHNPERKAGSTELHAADSFIAFTNRHKAPETVIFADEAKSSFTTVFDGHAEGADNYAGAGFGKFRAVYSCPMSPEWLAWLAHDGHWMGQQDFAWFLEERILEVTTVAAKGMPTRLREAVENLQAKLGGQAEIHGLSRGLKVYVGAKAEAKYDVNSGEQAITFEETHRSATGGKVQVPNLFALAIPIFKDGQPYIVPVRLRYRVSEGQVKWSYGIYRKEVLLKDAFDSTAAEIATGTELPVFAGAAPAEAPIR